MNDREATYTQAQEHPYEQTRWQILIDGKIIPRIVSFQLDQRFNAHHIFTLRIHHAELEEARNYRIDNTRFLFGKTLTATMGSTLEEDRVQFQGVITRVSLTHNQGLNGDLIIEGYSPTILLDSGQHLASFYKQSLESIAKTLTSPLSGKLEVAYAIRFQQALPYLTQYAESGFAFLNRLCAWLGEWCYYDGRKLCLGRPNTLPRRKIYFGKHLDDYKMEVQVAPLNFTQVNYSIASDHLIHYTPQEGIQLNYYGDLALDFSSQLFPNYATQAPALPVEKEGGVLMQMAEAKKAALAAANSIITGVCKSPYLMPGTLVTLCFGEQTLGEYLVTEVSHQLECNSQYKSTFKAISNNAQVIPTPIPPPPQAAPQLAVVKHNDDPAGQGRVRVQFQWQTESQLTDWIAVMSPDAGGSGEKVAKNRGFVFIPEVGDLVMVGFRNQHPDAPFVMGSLHHGPIASGGGQGNRNKSLTTRSGSTLILDDKAGSVTVSDPSGNVVRLLGNGQIIIHAPQSITFDSKDIVLNAANSIHLNALPAKEGAGDGIIALNAKKSISGVAAEETIRLTAKQDVDIISTQAQATLQGQTQTRVKSEGTVLVKGPKTEVKGDSIQIVGAEVNINES